MRSAHPDRLRLAELTSGFGALVLGIGIGALLGEHLAGFGLLLLIAGAAAHAWGMFDKHRLGSAVPVLWTRGGALLPIGAAGGSWGFWLSGSLGASPGSLERSAVRALAG